MTRENETSDLDNGDRAESSVGSSAASADVGPIPYFLRRSTGKTNGRDSHDARGSDARDVDSLSDSQSTGLEHADVNHGNQTRADKKRAAFNRLASRRVSKVLDAMTAIAPLTNRAFYDWTPEQFAAIFAALEGKVSELRKSFEAAMRPKEKKKRTAQEKQLTFRL